MRSTLNPFEQDWFNVDRNTHTSYWIFRVNYEVNGEVKVTDTQLVVLVNRGTSAEIVSR